MACFLVLVGWFFINDEQPVMVLATGFALVLVLAVLVGLTNGSLIRFGKFTAIAATLTLYIGLQGLSFNLRDSPDGYINVSVSDALTAKVGPVPIAFIVLVAVTIVLELFLRRRRWEWRLRAVGTSLLGGRGTFVGTLFGSILLIQVLNATSFLGLSQMWEYTFQGLVILAAAILYSLARSRTQRSLG